MADEKLIAQAEATSLASTDILYVVVDPGGTPLSRKITKANLGLIDISGTPVTNDFSRFTDADIIEGRNYAETRGDLTEINIQTGTTYETVASDDGKIITLNNGSAITLTVHSTAPAEFHCLIVQKGAGQVTVAAGGTGNVRNYGSHTKLAGQYATGTIVVESNAGTAPEVYFSGRTAA